MEHRGQVGVVVVQGMGEDSVHERREVGRQPLLDTDRRGAGDAALLPRPVASRAAGIQRRGSDGDAEGVKDAHLHALHDVTGQIVEGGPGSERSQLLSEGLLVSAIPTHAETSASGRTGEPVAP